MQNYSQERIEEISRRLSVTLDCLGYSPGMIELRRLRKKEIHHYLDMDSPLCSLRTVGSKGEGICRFEESDTDMLAIIDEIVCIEQGNSFDHFSNTVMPLTMVPCLHHPGHVKLLNLKQHSSEGWESSADFLDFCKNYFGTSLSSGPAVCTTGDNGNYDHVFSYRSFCPGILKQWLKRPRKYEWPSIEVRQRLSQMTGNVVATGIKGCPNQKLEWRLCFNEIETALVENWNDTQTKLYVVFKMIKKDILKSEGKITSFQLKNIVFWLSETYPQCDFRPETLFLWVIKALRLLKRALKRNRLPYFMIPKRNLIAEKVPKQDRKCIIIHINDILHTGPQILWYCEKLEMATAMSPSELRIFHKKSDDLENMAMLILKSRVFATCVLGLTKFEWMLTDSFRLPARRCLQLLDTPWPVAVQKNLDKYSDLWEKFKIPLR